MTEERPELSISDADRAAHAPNAARPAVGRGTIRWWAVLSDPDVYDQLSPAAQVRVQGAAKLVATVVVTALILLLLWLLGPAPVRM